MYNNLALHASLRVVPTKYPSLKRVWQVFFKSFKRLGPIISLALFQHTKALCYLEFVFWYI